MFVWESLIMNIVYVAAVGSVALLEMGRISKGTGLAIVGIYSVKSSNIVNDGTNSFTLIIWKLQIVLIKLLYHSSYFSYFFRKQCW